MVRGKLRQDWARTGQLYSAIYGSQGKSVSPLAIMPKFLQEDGGERDVEAEICGIPFDRMERG